MCDHLECHGNGLRISYVGPIHLYHPPEHPHDPSWPVDEKGWAEEYCGYRWCVEFRTGGFLASYHEEWQDALNWAHKYLELEGGHGS